MPNKAKLLIHVRSHHVLLTNITDRTLVVIRELATTLIQYGLVRQRQRFFKKALKVFAASTADRSEYRFHIAYYRELINRLKEKGFKEGEDYEIIVEPIIRGKEIEFEISPTMKPRPHQVPAIAYLKKEDPRAKLLGLRTGDGKSYSSMQAAADIGRRNVYLMRPSYMDKWWGDFEKTYVTHNSVLVQGGAQLRTLLQLAVDGELEYGNIVISNRTFQRWLTEYEAHGRNILEMGWPAIPDKFTELLQADILTIDELHLDFHLNFKIYLYTHVHNSFGLTATLMSGDKLVSSVMNRIHPLVDQYTSKTINRYTAASAYLYQLTEPNKVQTTEYGDKNYSHNAFERSILRNKELTQSYFELINTIVQVDYMEPRSPGESMLIFCASVRMCQLLCAWLQKLYPDEKVEYFVAGGDYTEDFLNASIVVTTVGKSGTAVDKANLRTVLLTNALDSQSTNIQVLGRLRELKESGNTPRFIYFVCADIKKHMEYHKRKQEFLPQYVKTLRTRRHDSLVGP